MSIIVHGYLTQYFVVVAEKGLPLYNAETSVNHSELLGEQRLVFITQGSAASSSPDHRATAVADRDVMSRDDSWRWGEGTDWRVSFFTGVDGHGCQLASISARMMDYLQLLRCCRSPHPPSRSHTLHGQLRHAGHFLISIKLSLHCV